MWKLIVFVVHLYEVDASLVTVERLDARDDTTTVPDRGEHSDTRDHSIKDSFRVCWSMARLGMKREVFVEPTTQPAQRAPDITV